MSARELDELAGLQPGHTRYIETGQRDRVEARTLHLIAGVFGTTIDWLYSGLGEGPSNVEVVRAVERTRRARSRKKTGTND